MGGIKTSIYEPKNSGAISRRTKSQLSLDNLPYANMNIRQIVDFFADVHPDFSFALWNYLRIAESGYDIQCFDIETGEPLEDVRLEITRIIERSSLPSTDKFQKSRSFDKVINQLLMSVLLRGAAAVEVIPTSKYDDIDFFSPVDPGSIEFRYENNRFVPYQDNGRISLDIPTFIHNGLDEKIDDPYGRSPLISAINTIIFQLEVLNDIKAVVHTQGYPRLDIEILEELILKRMPIQIRSNPDEAVRIKWMQQQIDAIKAQYSTLEPDETFIHFDSLKIGMTEQNKAMFDPQKLMTVIDNLIMTGLKTLSTILGRRSSGSTESYAKLEIKMYTMGVNAIQGVVEETLSKALTLSANILGMQAHVKFKFKDIEIRSELEQEQFKILKYQNIAYLRDQGWIDQDQASIMAVGKPAVGEPIGDTTRTNAEGQPVGGTTDVNPRSGGRKG